MSITDRKTARAIPGRSSGFTLLEVLVALLVLSIGMLGIGALNARGIRYTNDAYLEGIAGGLALSVLERMRAVADRSSDPEAALAPFDSRITPPPSGTTVACTSATMYSGDPAEAVACWYQQVAAALPGGEGKIVRFSGETTPGDLSDDEYRVTIRWIAGNTTRTQTWSFVP